MDHVKRFLLLAFAVTLIALPVGNAVAGGLNLAGVGAKALAMSGAFRGIADDWSAMYWNPAGLAGQGSGIWLEAKVLYPITSVTPNTPNMMDPYDGYYLYRNGWEQTSVSSGHPSGALAFQYQVQDNLTAGLAVYAPSALGAEWDNLFIGPYNGYNEDPEYPTKDWYSDLKVINIHPTVGFKVTDRFSVGAGLIAKYATVTLRNPNVVWSNDGTGSPLPMPNQHFFVDSQLDGEGWGFGFNIGVLYDITEKLHMGVSYASASTIPLTGEVRQTMYLPAVAGGGTMEVIPDAEADFDMPQEAGVGFAYDFSKKFTLAADVYWVNWESFDEIMIELEGDGLDGNPAEDTPRHFQWQNTIRYNVGFNYIPFPEKFELRMGYYFDPTPVPDETLIPTLSDVADKSNISIGVLYYLTKNMTFDFYWEHLFSGTKEAEAYDVDGDGFYDNVPGTWKLNVDTFGMQLGYRF